MGNIFGLENEKKYDFDLLAEDFMEGSRDEQKERKYLVTSKKYAGFVAVKVFAEEYNAVKGTSYTKEDAKKITFFKLINDKNGDNIAPKFFAIDKKAFDSMTKLISKGNTCTCSFAGCLEPISDKAKEYLDNLASGKIKTSEYIQKQIKEQIETHGYVCYTHQYVYPFEGALMKMHLKFALNKLKEEKALLKEIQTKDKPKCHVCGYMLSPTDVAICEDGYYDDLTGGNLTCSHCLTKMKNEAKENNKEPNSSNKDRFGL